MTRLSKETGRPVWFLLTDRVEGPGALAPADGQRASARAAGAHITAQVAGRPVGDHHGSGGLVQPVLDPAELHPARNPARRRAPGTAARPRDAAAAALRKSRPSASSRACRRRGRTWSGAGTACTSWARRPITNRRRSSSIAAIAASGNSSPQEVAYDYLTEGLDRFLFFPITNYVVGDHGADPRDADRPGDTARA